MFLTLAGGSSDWEQNNDKSMTKIQGKSSMIRVSQGSSYRESTVFEKTHSKSIELVRVLEILEKTIYFHSF